jgi:hypothetical protein
VVLRRKRMTKEEIIELIYCIESFRRGCDPEEYYREISESLDILFRELMEKE